MAGIQAAYGSTTVLYGIATLEPCLIYYVYLLKSGKPLYYHVVNASSIHRHRLIVVAMFLPLPLARGKPHLNITFFFVAVLTQLEILEIYFATFLW